MPQNPGLITPPRTNNSKRKADVANSPADGQKPTKTQAYEQPITTKQTPAANVATEMTPDMSSAASKSCKQDKDPSPPHMAQDIDHVAAKVSTSASARALRDALDSLKAGTNAPVKSPDASSAAECTGIAAAAAVSAGVPKATAGVAQVPSNVTNTSHTAASSASCSNSSDDPTNHEMGHADDNDQAMELAIDGSQANAPSISDGFTAITKRKNRKPLSQETAERLSRTVYLTGIQVNLAKTIAIDHADEFQQALNNGFGPVNGVEVIHDAIRITCATQEQKEKILSIDTVLGHNVKTSLPHCLTKPSRTDLKEGSHTTLTWKKGVIKTPLDMDVAFIKEYTGAIWAHRITVKRDNKIIETPSVILAFEENPPVKIMIGLYSFAVEPFIPKPIRCGKCQRYGHKTRDCKKAKETCPRCAGNHSFTECNPETNTAKCANCGGQHSAAYKGCSRYKTVSTALKSTVTEGLSYSEALKKASIQSRTENAQIKTAATKQQSAPPKQDSSTQTETNTETQTDNTSQGLAEIVQATVDAVNWLLTQIKVTASQKPLLEELQKQYAVFSSILVTKAPTTATQAAKELGAIPKTIKQDTQNQPKIVASGIPAPPNQKNLQTKDKRK
jgi:hypothetical protein